MGKPASGIRSSDRVERLFERGIKHFARAGFGCALEGLELGPAILDLRAVRRIWWQIKQSGASRFNGLAYTLDFMRAQFVHNDNVTRQQSGRQHLRNIRPNTDESVAPSTVMTASMPLQDKAPSAATLGPWFLGTASTTRWPRPTRP